MPKICVCIFILIFCFGCQNKTSKPVFTYNLIQQPQASRPQRTQASSLPPEKSHPVTPKPSYQSPLIPSSSATPIPVSAAPDFGTVVSPSPLSEHSSSGGTSSGGYGNNIPNSPPQTDNSDVWWDDILLLNGRQSIKGSQASTDLKGDLSSNQPIELILTGNFNITPDLTLDCLRFTPEFGLIHQYFKAERPLCKIIMDDFLLWNVTSITSREIIISLDRRGIGELYLTGLHKLVLETPTRREEQIILVGSPENVADLRPVISQIQVIKNNQQNPSYLKIQGAQLMLNPGLIQAKVDGSLIVPEYMQFLSDNSWEVFLPVPENFDTQITHIVQYTTPFGFTFSTLQGVVN